MLKGFYIAITVRRFHAVEEQGNLIVVSNYVLALQEEDKFRKLFCLINFLFAWYRKYRGIVCMCCVSMWLNRLVVTEAEFFGPQDSILAWS